MLTIAAVFLCDEPMIVVFTFFVMPYQYKADGVVLATGREKLISFRRTMLRHSRVFLLSRMPTIRIVATMTNQLTRSCKKVCLGKRVAQRPVLDAQVRLERLK